MFLKVSFILQNKNDISSNLFSSSSYKKFNYSGNVTNFVILE